jgi:hypothetical protein
MCSRQVHDVSKMGGPEAEVFLADHMEKPPKLRLYRREDGRVMESECPTGARERRRWRIVSGVAAAVAVGGVIAFLR